MKNDIFEIGDVLCSHGMVTKYTDEWLVVDVTKSVHGHYEYTVVWLDFINSSFIKHFEQPMNGYYLKRKISDKEKVLVSERLILSDSGNYGEY